MDLAPPPTASRIQDVGDRLIVCFRPQRSWIALAFFAFWLTFWTFGGIAAFVQMVSGNWSERPFLLLWLGAWAAGECTVSVVIAWQLFGRELLIVTPERLEVQQKIGRFARTKLYEIALVENIEAARVPSDEDERPRKGFCLKVSYDGRTVRIGEGMGEREAEYVATIILERIRPRSWWDEDEPTPPAPLRGAMSSEPEGTGGHLALRQFVFPLIVIAALGWLAVNTLRGGDGDSSSQPLTATVRSTPQIGRPSVDAFAAVRTLASAETAHALANAGVLVLGLPKCHVRRTSRNWTCLVRARSAAGPLAGQTLTYRCSSVMSGVLCGPALKPPLGG